MSVPTGFGNYPAGVTDNDPHFGSWEEDEDFEDDPAESVLGEFVWDCGNADCCMNFQPHYRSECYTPDEYDAYVEECERASQSTSGEASD